MAVSTRARTPQLVSPIDVSAAVTAAEWDAFVESHGETIEQLWAWREIYRDVFGHPSVYLVARRNAAIVGALPLVMVRSLLFGRLVISLPFANYGGVIGRDAEATAALVEAAGRVGREFGAGYVELRNTERHLPALPCRTHKVGARLQLPSTARELFDGLDRKVRNQIRKAQKEQVAVVHGGVELLDDFYDVFARNMRDLGTPVFPRALFTGVFRLLPHHAQLFVARHGDRPIAVACALTWRDTMLVPWASSLRQHRHLSGNMLLYWTMLEAAIGHGARVFDFGRSTVGSTTLAFKQQWNPTSIPLHWEYVLLRGAGVAQDDTSGRVMQWLVRSWQQLPDGVAKWIGPVVTRHLK